MSNALAKALAQRHSTGFINGYKRLCRLYRCRFTSLSNGVGVVSFGDSDANVNEWSVAEQFNEDPQPDTQPDSQPEDPGTGQVASDG